MTKQSHTGKSPKSGTGHGDWHVSHDSQGMGDFYGTGVRNPQGKMRRGWGEYYAKPESLSVPPKRLA